MTIYIGIDDTDGKSWMCTTYLAIEVLRRLNFDVSFKGFPRLVRLNPNVPWKTRGNGAICLPIIAGSAKNEIGRAIESPIFSCELGEDPDEEEVYMAAKSAVEDLYYKGSEETRPGIVILSERGPEEFYWKAVREVVTIDEARKIVEKMGGKWYGINGGRGIIGALAAISWPRLDVTYELLTYKGRRDWRKEARVEEESAKRLDVEIPSSFDNYDYENDHPCILPRAITPVLYGVRGEDPEELKRALRIVKADPPPKEWLIFETNQGTDDHILRKRVSEVKKYSGVLLEGIVKEKPRIIKGGHVIFKLKDETGEIECAAYEPTKSFRRIVMALIPGDLIRVWGSVSSYEKTVNVEKIQILKLEKKYKRESPRCPKCGKKMKHIGRGKGYRCKRCHIRLPEEAARIIEEERGIFPGIYEVPPSARRHLAMPLKRGVKIERDRGRNWDSNNPHLGSNKLSEESPRSEGGGLGSCNGDHSGGPRVYLPPNRDGLVLV